MAVVSPVILEAEEIGSPVSHIRVKWNDPAYGTANAATGFDLIHDDETGTLPAWTAAIDAGLAGGGDGAGNFEVLLPVPLSGGVATFGETFEEYPLGTITGPEMTGGGPLWGGHAVLTDAYRGIIARDDFESYATGPVVTLDGGNGWDGAAVIHEL